MPTNDSSRNTTNSTLQRGLMLLESIATAVPNTCVSLRDCTGKKTRKEMCHDQRDRQLMPSSRFPLRIKNIFEQHVEE